MPSGAEDCVPVVAGAAMRQAPSRTGERGGFPDRPVAAFCKHAATTCRPVLGHVRARPLAEKKHFAAGVGGARARAAGRGPGMRGAALTGRMTRAVEGAPWDAESYDAGDRRTTGWADCRSGWWNTRRGWVGAGLGHTGT